MMSSISVIAAISMPVAGVVCHLHQPASPEDAAAALHATGGAEYVAARSVILGAPQEEFNSVMAALRAIPNSYRPAALADAIEFRRLDPKLAAKFDSLPQAAWDSAQWDAGGERVITLFDPGADPPPEYAPLVVEFVLKRSEAADEIRSAFVHAVPASCEAVLAVLEVVEDLPDSFGIMGERACRLAASTHDIRIPPAIIAAYDRYRERFPNDFMSPHQATWRLRNVHTAIALDAIRSIVASERTWMETRGYAPWNDIGAKEDYRAAVLQQSRERMAAARQREQLGPEAHAQLGAEVEDARARWKRRALWESINDTLAALEATLEP